MCEGGWVGRALGRVSAKGGGCEGGSERVGAKGVQKGWVRRGFRKGGCEGGSEKVGVKGVQKGWV